MIKFSWKEVIYAAVWIWDLSESKLEVGKPTQGSAAVTQKWQWAGLEAGRRGWRVVGGCNNGTRAESTCHNVTSSTSAQRLPRIASRKADRISRQTPASNQKIRARCLALPLINN